MKVILLLAHSGERKLDVCKQHIQTVFSELDIQIDTVDLHGLPYYKVDQVSPVAALMAEKIEQAKGVVALVSAHIGGMHSTMHSFFEHFTRYAEHLKDKPLFVVTDTAYQGERQVAYQVLQAWETLGGIGGGNCCMNQYTPIESVLDNMERDIEAYYRLLKQSRSSIRCSEYYIYNNPVEAQTKYQQPKEEPRMYVSSSIHQELEVKKDNPLHIDLSTKEQNIHELTQLLKQQMIQPEDDESEFVEMPKTTYNKPLPKARTSSIQAVSKVSSIPHHFVAQHDKAFQTLIQYILTDTDEKGVIKIADGDCTYEGQTTQGAQVEMMLSQEVLEQIMRKQLTYQKAFMIGKLKVKGNFGILAKLDQVFR